jgi:hypothetical protein
VKPSPTESVFVVAGRDVLFFPTAAELLEDVRRMDLEEARSAIFYDLDGQVLELSFTGESPALRQSGRRDLDALRAALAELSGGQGDSDPHAVANEVLAKRWLSRWPRRPAWLRRLLHGTRPPTV